jgi:hypothetical protein
MLEEVSQSLKDLGLQRTPFPLTVHSVGTKIYIEGSESESRRLETH